MNILTNTFERILTTAHHFIINDRIDKYNKDFSGTFSFRDKSDYNKFHEIGTSIASALLQHNISTFVMAYDTIAFCIKFHSNFTFSGINMRMIADAATKLPHSTGEPQIFIGADNISLGFGWRPARLEEADDDSEIFPLIDFESLCFYYAIPKKRDSSRPTPQIFRIKASPLIASRLVPSSDKESQSSRQLSASLND